LPLQLAAIRVIFPCCISFQQTAHSVKRVETARKELSREFTMQGLLCGKDDPGPCRSTNDDLQYTVRKEIILE
jgi:hypothetical protein